MAGKAVEKMMAEAVHEAVQSLRDDESSSAFVCWLSNDIFRLRQEVRALSDLTDPRCFRHKASRYKECVDRLAANLDFALDNLGDGAAQDAFNKALRIALDCEKRK